MESTLHIYFIYHYYAKDSETQNELNTHQLENYMIKYRSKNQLCVFQDVLTESLLYISGFKLDAQEIQSGQHLILIYMNLQIEFTNRE